jgi:regulator of protease activity HflC (stomatin/prohibitin superfamily)
MRMSSFLTSLTVLAAILIVGFSVISAAIKVVREYQRLVVFRFGRSIGKKGPGLVFLIPIIDKAVWVDLREFFLEIPSQTCITKDNASINIDFLIYFKVFEPDQTVIQVTDFAGAARGIAMTTLRAVVGDISLDDVLAQREKINQVLRAKLDEVTERWGVKVTTVEIREILPPREIQEAMTRQMSAERTRRAVVTEAEGKRQATITVAEGDKQSAILRAEGERQAAILRAEGFSLALDRIFSVAKNIDSKTLTLQYLEALKTLGEGASTKFIFPLEFTKLLQPIVESARDAAGQK